MLAAAIANSGTLLRPYLISQVRAPGQAVIRHARPAVLRHVISSRVASLLRAMMTQVTQNPAGTAYPAAGPPATSIVIAGTTGTAQNGSNNSGLDDAVFTCFAPASNPPDRHRRHHQGRWPPRRRSRAHRSEDHRGVPAIAMNTGQLLADARASTGIRPPEPGSQIGIG